jgi:hypothetical protein
MPKKKDDEGLSNLVSQAEAARITGLTRAAINYLVNTGTLRSKEILGKRAVYRSEVESYRRQRAPRKESKKGSRKR